MQTGGVPRVCTAGHASAQPRPRSSVDVRCGGARACGSIGEPEISEIGRDRVRAHAVAHEDVVVEELAEELGELLRLLEGGRRVRGRGRGGEGERGTGRGVAADLARG